MRTQYQRFDKKLPQIVLKLRLDSSTNKITLGQDFSNFSSKLKSQLMLNISKLEKLSCLEVKEIGYSRPDTRLLKTVDNNKDYISA